MKIKELRQKKVGDLHKLLKSSRENLRSLRFSISSEQEKNVRKIRDIKKDIAKILTILNTKETGSTKIEKEEISSKGDLQKAEEVKKD
jgi:large subunit ribosomal protein L29